jgi:myo-inositol 2-dehydrogenase/D-chiro-inositol 1-dehydrogenase
VSTRAQKFAKTTGADVAKGPKGLLRRKGLDAVLIAAPTPAHEKLARLAIERGVPVLCESPLSLDHATAHALVQEARSAAVPLAISEPEAFHPGRNAVVANLRARELGGVGFIKTYRRSGYPKGQGRWYRDAEESGGLLYTKMVHDFAWVQRHFGNVTRVFAQGVRRPTGEGLEYALATLTIDGGIVAQCVGAWTEALPSLQTLEVCSAAGMVQWNSADTAIRQSPRKGATISRFQKKGMFVDQWRAFERFLAKPKLKKGWDRTRSAVAALRVAEAAARSVDTQAPVKV